MATVRSNGDPWAKYIYVGDDNNNVSLQGFVTFDISDIPDDADIDSVKVDLSDYSSPFGTPFEDLGCLRVYVDNYGTLDGGDYYDGSPTGAIVVVAAVGAVVVDVIAKAPEVLKRRAERARVVGEVDLDAVDVSVARGCPRYGTSSRSPGG